MNDCSLLSGCVIWKYIVGLLSILRFSDLVFYVVSMLCRGSSEGYQVCLSLVWFSYFSTIHTEIFCWAKLFQCVSRLFRQRLESSLSATIVVEISQPVVDQKLAVKFELVLIHYPCHSKGSNTHSGQWRVQKVFKGGGQIFEKFCRPFL